MASPQEMLGSQLRPEVNADPMVAMQAKIDELTAKVEALTSLQAEVDTLRAENIALKEELGRNEVDNQETVPLPPVVAQETSSKKGWGERAKVAGVAVLIGALAVATAIGITRGSKSDKQATGTTIEKPTTTSGSTTKEKIGPVAPSAQELRLAPLKDKKIDTIEEATRAYKGENFDMAVEDILGNPDAFKNVDINHFYSRYINAKGFNDKMSTQNALEAKLIGITQDEANAQSAANLIEKKAKDGARTDSHAEQIELIRKFLLDKDTKIDGDYRLNGHWGNGLVGKDGKLATHVRVFNNHRAVRITGDNGAEWIFTLDSISEVKEGNCFNDVVDVPEPPKSTPPRTGKPPVTPPEVCPIPGLGNLPKDDPKCKKEKAPAKEDRNTTPGGVPGQNGGSGTTPEPGPTGPGTGPSGQPVNPVGTVGGEVLPPAPQPEPTPSPVPAPPAPPVTPGEIHPNPTPPVTPPTPATGSETPAPTTPIDPQG